MASRSAGTLMTEFNAAFVPPALMPGYKGHVPTVASSFGSSYGNTTLKYFQDFRNAALEKSYALLSGGRFPTIFSPNPSLVLTSHAQNWDRWLHLPIYARSNLDSSRNFEITNFYQSITEGSQDRNLEAGTRARSLGEMLLTVLLSVAAQDHLPEAVQQQRNFLQDKTGTVPSVPYFVLPVKERDRYPLPTDLPPLSPKNKWHLLRVSSDYRKHCQTFPSGKRVSSQERQRRDLYFEFRA
ncbi:hypothetical protein STEG23_008386 [Scotinomys teguina]